MKIRKGSKKIKIWLSILIICLLAFFMGIKLYIDSIESKTNSVNPLTYVQTYQNGDQQTSILQENEELLLNPGKGWVSYDESVLDNYEKIINIRIL